MVAAGPILNPNPLKAIGLKVTSVTIFMGMSSFIKAVGEVPPGQIVFYRSLFAIFPILAVLAWRRQLSTAFRTSRPLSHIARGLVGVSAMGLSFYGLTMLPLPEVVTLGYAQPLMVVVLSALVLGETVRIFRWSAVAIGFVGVFIISWPKLTLLTGGQPIGRGEFTGLIAVLVSTLISAVAAMLVRRLVHTEHTQTIVIWFSLTATVAGLCTIPFGWAQLSPGQTAFLVAAGMCGGVGQILMTQAYRYAGLATVAPFEYTSIILAVAIGYYAFGDVPTVYTLVGGAIVVAAGLLIIWREHRLGLPRAAARKVMPPHG